MARLLVPAGGASQERSGLTFWPPAPVYTALVGMGLPSCTTWLLTFNGAGLDMATPPAVPDYARRVPDARPLSSPAADSRPGRGSAVRGLCRRAGAGGPRSPRASSRPARLGSSPQEEALALRSVHHARAGGGHGDRRDGLRLERLLRRGGPP